MLQAGAGGDGGVAGPPPTAVSDPFPPDAPLPLSSGEDPCSNARIRVDVGMVVNPAQVWGIRSIWVTAAEKARKGDTRGESYEGRVS